MNGEYQTKDDKLNPYKNLEESLKESFINITFEQIPRENNRVANTMEMIGSLLNIPHNIPKHEFLVEQLLLNIFELPKS